MSCPSLSVKYPGARRVHDPRIGLVVGVGRARVLEQETPGTKPAEVDAQARVFAVEFLHDSGKSVAYLAVGIYNRAVLLIEIQLHSPLIRPLPNVDLQDGRVGLDMAH